MEHDLIIQIETLYKADCKPVTVWATVWATDTVQGGWVLSIGSV